MFLANGEHATSLCHVTKFSFYLSQFTVACNILKKLSSFMPVLSIKIILDGV